MSTGFAGIALALQLCKKVDIYGFGQSQGHYYMKAKAPGLKFDIRHPWRLEKECIKVLGRNRFVRYRN